MFAYYLDLAWRSLKRTLVLTGLMVLAIGLGIGASMTMLTVLHVMTADPLPGRSAHLYKPYVDPLPLKFTTDPLGTDPRNNLTWPDSMALLHARRAVRQAAMAGGTLLVWPRRTDLQPFYVDDRYTTPDFFAMFGVPFIAGSGWNAAEETANAHASVPCNCAFMIVQRMQRVSVPTGIDEDALSVIRSSGIGKDANPWARHQADVAALRTIPGVESAVAVSYSLPLDRDQSSYTTCPTREALDRVIAAISVKGTGCLQPSVFDGSPRLVKTLGLRLVAGRDFRSDEYVSGDDPPAAIIPQIRAQYFERDRTMIGLLIASALGLLFVTALGIAGLANFWVGQRNCSIGIRRAVGATRVDILRYFLTENFVIVTGGVVLGAILAVSLNLLLMQHHELPRLPLWYLAVGAIALWFLGQLSVLARALRASRVPPVVATRSV
ncbi:MAG: ABC transporter permease [Rhodanobacteraceae bacterium]